MKEDIRIGVLGIGGTGGYFGGKLATFYKDSDAVKVVFIARNETKSLIKKQGLQVESVEEDFSIKPSLVSDDPAEIGPLDILFVCVKSYSLEEATSKYIQNVKRGGVVITIQNSVSQLETLQNILPEGVTHLEGCAYILSNQIGPGHIKHKGGPATIFFGNDTALEEFKWAEDIFTQAGVKATLTHAISKTIWKKFLFISPLAVATSYFSCSIGELRSSPNKYHFLKGLMAGLQGGDLSEVMTSKSAKSFLRYIHSKCKSFGHALSRSGHRDRIAHCTYITKKIHVIACPVARHA